MCVSTSKLQMEGQKLGHISFCWTRNLLAGERLLANSSVVEHVYVGAGVMSQSSHIRFQHSQNLGLLHFTLPVPKHACTLSLKYLSLLLLKTPIDVHLG